MPSLVEIAFKGNRKEFFHWHGDEPLPLRAAVIVEAERGEDLGRVHATGELAQRRAAGVPHRPTEEAPVVFSVRRLATDDEVSRAAELREQDEVARRRAMERVKANNLVMKLTDAEWRWDRRKLTIYFTAEKRVDFRNLVRELASMFRTRIELRQIGVRDEARRLGGIGRCGREYCSSSWLPELRPVNLGVAKDQRLSLNPTQISGACGRLMCCLRYEHDFYVQQRRRFPKEGKLIETSRGEEKVLSNDIFRERVTLRAADGEVRIVPLAELRREWRNPPAGTQGLEEDTSPIPLEAISDEVLRLQDTSEMPAWRPGSSPEARRSSRHALPVMPPRAEPPRDADAGAERGHRGAEREGARRHDPRRGEGREGRAERDAGRRDGARRGTRDGHAARKERRDEGAPAVQPKRPEPRAEYGHDASRHATRDDAHPAADARDDVDDAADADALASGTAGSGDELVAGERRMRRRRGRRGGRRARGEREPREARGEPGTHPAVGREGRTPPSEPHDTHEHGRGDGA